MTEFKENKNQRQSKNSRVAHDLLRGRPTDLSDEDREKVKEIVKEDREKFFFYSDPSSALVFGVLCMYCGLLIAILNWSFTFGALFDNPERRMNGGIESEKPE